MIRFPAREIYVGNKPLGGRNPIRLQSMTNTDTRDVEATVAQTIRIFEAGADYVRISVPNSESASVLPSIRKKVSNARFDYPLIADIHFKPELALIAARYFEAVRINPGNYTGMPSKNQIEWSESQYQSELDEMRNNLKPLLKTCKEYGRAIRIGTNFGSLSKRVISRLGNTPEAMVVSTLEFLQAFESLGFTDTAISLKASNPIITIKAYLLMVERMQQMGMAYPLHVGVTEAGEGEDGRIKSALGISTLLQMGIGDTIRVSLSEAPEEEIPVARKIAEPFQNLFTNTPREGEVYRIPIINFNPPNPPPIPYNLKAVVLSDQEDASCDFVLLKNTKEFGNAEKDENCFTQAKHKATGEIFPVFSVQALSNPSTIFDAQWNFLWIDFDNDLPKLETLKNVPGLILIFETKCNNLTNAIEQLREHLFRLELNPVLVVYQRLIHRSEEDVLLTAVEKTSLLLLQRKIHGLIFRAPVIATPSLAGKMVFGLLQATGIRITRNEYISCPTCSRTSFDLVAISKKVKEITQHISGLKIAVMGCVVNGPGEMADADFGILGAGPGKVHLYKGLTPIKRNLTELQALDALAKLIESQESAHIPKNE
ncbi:MAG TPA: 4-hydroxy-3-methylbut-2-en-1-yl diphosphate synthase [Bacteroidales bacterium]|nr:4-hydroxy-3-methylbut-2-en-1-yl diphosphate synthase [Bacteroidales bacterium]